jgi:molybdopterin molybdotransferase
MASREEIGFQKAYRLTINSSTPINKERISIFNLEGKIIAEDLFAKVDSPGMDSSLKDGYAVISSDVKGASVKSPRKLKLIGRQIAGEPKKNEVKKGCAIRVTTGALLPKGAQAVVSEEFANERDGWVEVFADAEKGRNVLMRGGDVKVGTKIIEKGERLTPDRVGLIAASGNEYGLVYQRPNVVIIATGSEIVISGSKLKPGKIFASNLIYIYSWLTSLGMNIKSEIVKDDPISIEKTIRRYLDCVDVIITSGGAWKSEKDMVIKVLDKIGWRKIYHRVRMGPGKAIGYGQLNSKHIFCLPGGPLSNNMAFLQLTLPGLWRLSGAKKSLFPVIKAVLTKKVSGQKDWTQFIYGRLKKNRNKLYVEPITIKHRLQDVANTSCIICIPEGREQILEKKTVDIQIINKDDLTAPIIKQWL